MRLAPFRGNMLARGLEGSSTSRDGAECPGRALVAWGEGHPCAFRWATSKVLQFEKPLDVLKNCYPQNRFFFRVWISKYLVVVLLFTFLVTVEQN